jgi:hypothetical protein
MALTFIWALSNIVDPAAKQIVINKPTATAEGDLVILVVAQSENEDGNINTPSGFTSILANSPTGGTAPSEPAVSIFWKIAGASEPTSYTITFTNSVDTGGAGVCSVYRGIDKSTPIDVGPLTWTSASSNAPDPPAVTTTVDGTYSIIGGLIDGASTGALALPTGYTGQGLAGRRTTATGGNGLVFLHAHKFITTAGSENPGVITNGGTAGEAMAFTFAIRPEQATRRIFIT